MATDCTKLIPNLRKKPSIKFSNHTAMASLSHWWWQRPLEPRLDQLPNSCHKLRQTNHQNVFIFAPTHNSTGKHLCIFGEIALPTVDGARRVGPNMYTCRYAGVSDRLSVPDPTVCFLPDSCGSGRSHGHSKCLDRTELKPQQHSLYVGTSSKTFKVWHWQGSLITCAVPWIYWWILFISYFYFGVFISRSWGDAFP